MLGTQQSTNKTTDTTTRKVYDDATTDASKIYDLIKVYDEVEVEGGGGGKVCEENDTIAAIWTSSIAYEKKSQSTKEAKDIAWSNVNFNVGNTTVLKDCWGEVIDVTKLSIHITLKYCFHR